MVLHDQIDPNHRSRRSAAYHALACADAPGYRDPEKVGAERVNGAVLMRWVRLRALLLVNLGLFALFMVGVLLTGHAHENEDLSDHGQPTESLVAYAGSSSFGETVFENWESEFLQMGMYVLLTTFLVQKGSAESRPIGETRRAGRGSAGSSQRCEGSVAGAAGRSWC